jgi:hypothetical protein
MAIGPQPLMLVASWGRRVTRQFALDVEKSLCFPWLLKIFSRDEFPGLLLQITDQWNVPPLGPVPDCETRYKPIGRKALAASGARN